MSAKPRPKKIARYKAGPQLSSGIKTLHRQYPGNNLYQLLSDVLKLPQKEQHELWFVVQAIVNAHKKEKRSKTATEQAPKN